MTDRGKITQAPSDQRAKAENILRVAADALLFLFVLCFSAFVVISIALAAPVALGLSALANVFSPSRERRRWRQTQPA